MKMFFIHFRNKLLYSKIATLLLGGFFVFASCSENESDKNYVAKVYNQKLYEKDIPDEIMNDAVKKEAFIHQWIDNNILYYHAKLDSRINKKEINQQLETIKQELYYFYYEELILKDRLDTIVSDIEIQKYYNTNKEEFVLKDFLVKVMYLKVPVDAPDLNKIKEKYLLEKPKDINDIIQYAKIYSSNFYYDEQNWIYFDAILKEVPLKDISKERFITAKKKIYFDDGNYFYFLNILDYKLKDALSPLSFEKYNIKKKILNIRLKNTRDAIKKDIINEEYKKGNVTIH